MHWRNIAPFCRDDGPQTGPMIHLPATWRHSGPTKVSITESHGEARREPLKFTPESFCRTKLCACPSASAGTNAVGSMAVQTGEPRARIEQWRTFCRVTKARCNVASNKNGSDASCIAAAIFLSSRSLQVGRYFGGSVSLKLENFQDVT